MAVKTITIDLEAYETLSRHKRKGQSFSEVIKEHFGGRRTARELQAALDTTRVSEEILEGIDRQIRLRRKSPARAPRL
jgi:predicted CopG family antitoxin